MDAYLHAEVNPLHFFAAVFHNYFICFPLEIKEKNIRSLSFFLTVGFVPTFNDKDISHLLNLCFKANVFKCIICPLFKQ